ncbi:hypothetical protein [Thiolapillus sp.]
MKTNYLLPALLLLSTGIASVYAAEKQPATDYHRAQWNPIHFSPAIDSATNEQCLSCHMEVLQRKVLDHTPAGVPTKSTRAWYQTLDTYKGPQETFHRRHLVTDYAKKVMQMKCTTCHRGENPREEAPIPPDQKNTRFTLRKQVNPETCLMCHGSFPDYKRMGLPSHWNESREMFQNNCLLCHAGVRTNRHKVNFLKPEAIEAAAKDDSDVCFGCHGGRQWYRISYPYPRHAWKGMPEKTPEWAKDRPTESNPRFLTKQQQAQK